MSFEPNANVEMGVYKEISESFIGKLFSETVVKAEIMTLSEETIAVMTTEVKYQSKQHREFTELVKGLIYKFGRWMEEEENVYTMVGEKLTLKIHNLRHHKELIVNLSGKIKNRTKDERLSDYGLGSNSLSDMLKDDKETKEKVDSMKSNFLEFYPHIAKLSYGQKVNEVSKHIKTMVDALSNSYGLDSGGKAVIMKDLREVYMQEVAEEVRLAEIKLKEQRKQNAVISESIDD